MAQLIEHLNSMQDVFCLKKKRAVFMCCCFALPCLYDRIYTCTCTCIFLQMSTSGRACPCGGYRTQGSRSLVSTCTAPLSLSELKKVHDGWVRYAAYCTCTDMHYVYSTCTCTCTVDVKKNLHYANVDTPTCVLIIVVFSVSIMLCRLIHNQCIIGHTLKDPQAPIILVSSEGLYLSWNILVYHKHTFTPFCHYCHCSSI